MSVASDTAGVYRLGIIGRDTTVGATTGDTLHTLILRDGTKIVGRGSGEGRAAKYRAYRAAMDQHSALVEDRTNRMPVSAAGALVS